MFNQWNKLYQSEQLEQFSTDNIGLLWLKIKSIVRKELIEEFIVRNNIRLEEKSLTKKFVELFELLCNDVNRLHKIIDDYIKYKNKIQALEIDTEQLVSELYKLKNFEWGGDYQNSLDKYLVNRYVKTNKSYDTLVSKFETEINLSVQGYVLNSWYNHWSSVLIEHIFKSHHIVLPTVGQVKSEDFFINRVPFDLKVTYLPTEYIKFKRKEKELPVEKMKDRNDEFCNNVLTTLKNEKLEILKEAQDSPKILAKWLYQNQGEMRFGSENRLFLVLVDTEDFNNSWKLKRNLDLLKPKIINYLDNFKNKKIESLKLKFNYKGRPQTFTTLTDLIFVVK